MVEKTKTLENDIINRETKVRDDFQENLGKTKQFLQKKSVTAFKKLQNDLKGLEKKLSRGNQRFGGKFSQH